MQTLEKHADSIEEARKSMEKLNSITRVCINYNNSKINNDNKYSAEISMDIIKKIILGDV